MRENKLVIICLDSFRFDYLERTKFLKSFALGNEYGELETTIGYNAVEGSLLTGKLPDEHGVWNEFWLDLNKKPFWLAKYFSVFEGTRFENVVRLLLALFFNGIRFLSGGNYFFNIHKIPLKQLSIFDTSLKETWVNHNYESGVNFFKQLRNKNKKFVCFDWPVKSTHRSWRMDLFTGNKDKEKVASLLKESDKYDVLWLRLWELDTVAHHYGINSTEINLTIRKLDNYCKKIVDHFSSRYNAKFLFWSDHGMCEVKETVDIESAVEDIIASKFIDSCWARFWVNSESDKKKLTGILRKFKKYGRIINKKDKKKFGLNFNHNKYGDVMFLADPGVLIFPNYYDRDHKDKSMHGYDPTVKDMKGVYIKSSNKAKQKNKHVTDLYGDLLELDGL